MYFDTNTLELEKVLNNVLVYAQTNAAKEEILKIRPVSNLDEINQMLNEVDEAYKAIVKISEIPLGGFKDKKDAIMRASIGGILSVEELADVSQSLYATRNVIKYFDSFDSIKLAYPSLRLYRDNLKQFKKIEDEINHSITPDLKISDNASMELFRIRKKLKMEETHLRNYMNSMLQLKAPMLQESLIATRDGHPTLPVKAEYKNQIKGIVRDSSSSGTTYFIEPEEAYKISATIEMIKADEKKEVNNILKGLSQLVNSVSEELLVNFDNLIKLDVIFAKANYALKNDMVKPEINDNGIISIKQGAHPLIDRDIVVKNDVELGKSYDTIIITGPNTGGKTVLLKMVGILTLMMQSGLFISAKEGSKLNVFDNVFSDIGDEQSIEQSLSTFSSHISKISEIVNKLTYNSLVLLDEVGSGTDPKEGASLAIAIIDYLTKKGSRVITTTHYSDLKAFAYNNPRIINASVEFKVETLKPTYRLQIGVAGKSNAILISRRIGLNEEILTEAQRVYSDSESDTSSLINKIDEENEKISTIKQEYEAKVAEYESLLNEVTLEKKEIQINYDSILKKAKVEAQKILDDAKEKSKDIIDELNKLKNTKYYEEHKLADAKHQVRSLNVEGDAEQIFDEQINVGDYVYIRAYQATGEVRQIKGNTYEVMVGKFPMKFKKEELSLDHKASIKKKEAPKKQKTTTVTTTSSATMRLDLRGYRYEEVREAVDKFLDQAMLASLPMVYIVHGFGTGAVRDAVYAYLKNCQYVKSYRYGGEGEGLNGCTVVYLK